MSELTPEEVETLVGAYALDAISPDERRAVEQLLAGSPRLRAEVDDYREIAGLLAYGGADAPDSVWDRIQDQLDGEPADVARLPLPFDRRRRGPSPWLAAVGGAVAAALVVVVGFVALDDDPEPTPEVAELDVDGSLAAASSAAFGDDSARTAAFSIGINAAGPVEAAVLADGTGFLVADGLPALPRDRTYQLWGKAGDEIISLGVLGADPTISVFEAGPDVTTLLLTDEVQGGVGASQNPAIGVAELS